ncbi:MAG: hypothetical protein AAGC63_07330 [Propionicimonas sp.]|nr:hypothetical protein [Propionicimonas sp.]
MEGFFILLLAGASFAAAVISVVVASGGRGWAPRTPPTGAAAQQILDDRLARGRIDVQDYLVRTAALRGEWANGMEYRPSEPRDDDSPAEPAWPASGTASDTRPASGRASRRIMDDRPLIHVMPGLIEPPGPPDPSRHR